MSKQQHTAVEPDLEPLSDLAKALSHPVRLKILRILNKENTCICNDLVIQLPVAQSTVSQHLKELKRVGLIHGEIDGPRICYCLNQKRISELKILFNEFFKPFKGK
jgi:DNA-binding transcriptional ArsR family regulator